MADRDRVTALLSWLKGAYPQYGHLTTATFAVYCDVLLGVGTAQRPPGVHAIERAIRTAPSGWSPSRFPSAGEILDAARALEKTASSAPRKDAQVRLLPEPELGDAGRAMEREVLQLQAAGGSGMDVAQLIKARLGVR